MPYPNNSSENGYYTPESVAFPMLPGYQSWVNVTKGKLSLQDREAIHNLIGQLPTLYAEGLRLAGETVLWVRRTTVGPRCKYFNEDSDSCDMSKCTDCFGTGYEGGYDAPVELKMSFIPGRADILIEEAGLTVTQRPTAWTIITDPIMSERDVLVTFANERYVIHSVEAVEHQGRKHHQELTLSRVDKTDVIYYLPVFGQAGNDIVDFVVSLVITPPIGVGGTLPGFNFPVSMVIKNYFFNPETGIDGEG